MTRRNRVTPLGELVDHPARGLVYGNRGCLHDADSRIVRSFNGKRWIACRLKFRGWRREKLMQPGRFTELFFLDEATTFAAGHRPCALCRREDYTRFLAILEMPGADAIDARLHEERLDLRTRTRRLHPGPVADLTDGVFVLHEGAPHLVLGPTLWRWTAAGYFDPKRRPSHGQVSVITPPSLVAVLQSGWQGQVPLLHPSAIA